MTQRKTLVRKVKSRVIYPVLFNVPGYELCSEMRLKHVELLNGNVLLPRYIPDTLYCIMKYPLPFQYVSVGYTMPKGGWTTRDIVDIIEKTFFSRLRFSFISGVRHYDPFILMGFTIHPNKGIHPHIIQL